jgi:DNA-binding protein H-NS
MSDHLSQALRPGAEHLIEPSVAEMERELAHLRVQRLRIEQRERALQEALGMAGRQRLRELVGLDGLEGVVRATLGSAARKPAIDTSKLAGSFVRKAALKYRHPDSPGLVWSGRGKKPGWIRDLEQQGRLDAARLTVGAVEEGLDTF